MKERNGRGQFRATETIAYKKKFKNHFGQFNLESEEAFLEAAIDKYDFVTCVRDNGTYYGNGGTKCNRGTIATKKDLKAEKKKAANGDKKAAANVAKMEKNGVGGGNTAAPKAASGGTPAAETLGRDGLSDLPDGAKVDLADGSVYQKDDGKFYRVKEDGSLSSLDYKPGELNQQAQYLAEQSPRKTEAPAETKSDSGSSSDIPPKGDYKDQAKMEKAADDWRKKNGLDDDTSDHDRVHMMVHAFDQKGSKEIGALTGEKGVSSTEEVLVNLASMNAQGHSSGTKYSRAELIREAKDMKQFLDEELSPAQKKNFNKAATAAVDEFLDMSKKDGFDDFMFTLEANSVDG